MKRYTVVGVIGLGTLLMALLVFLCRPTCIFTTKIPPCEVHAISLIFAVNQAEQSYVKQFPDRGFAADLQDLQRVEVREVDWRAAGLNGGSYYHYRLQYAAAAALSGAIRSYSITLIPDGDDRKCKHSYYTDESGQIHVSESDLANVSSPLLQ